MEFIPIEKDSIPYQFDIALGVDIFTFEVNYNERFDFFTLDLMKDDQVLLQGVKTRIRRSCFCRHRGPPLSGAVDCTG
ncbi:hypothetical protein WJ0W_006540 [Paenibacillus melissococcoides]|uniref:Cyanophage baseplate Pam3 plug gp18 domain-containing protein n=1 Tax=Paenibacillus melissococcoides TaxID=2912268 RepID=A0ABM9GBC2_9BACL|nr:hypothetical protein [Paenibacillus melissococcoides]CAH8249354.1 hypothetical protein WJ0W_006540 [Paenibacillus melissococcoides]